MRGAERSFAAMCDLYPDAPIATLLYDEDAFRDRLGGHAVSTSWLQKFGASQSNFKRRLPLLPYAAGRLPVDGHELVLSSSSAFAHGVRPDPGATHVCYCHTPFRYSWYERKTGIDQSPAYSRPLVRYSLDKIKKWDLRVAQRDTHYIANGRITQKRIREFWGREAPIVYPPVEIHRFRSSEPEDFFLVVGELVRHKQIEVALEAARRAHVPIKVVGTGVDQARLQAVYSDYGEFLGRIEDDDLAALYSRAKALVMPNIEEFGITAVEAQASGRPVIAADGGGARETVLDGQTGLFFPSGDASALAAAMQHPLLDDMDSTQAVANAQRFSVESFQSGFAAQVAEAQSLQAK
jgi:glycosyltransferase involved in cell wall biosynthesis